MRRKSRASFTGRATMADVAREVGASTITVSRAFRNPEMVSPELRARILETSARLGYVTSRAASTLASARSRTVLVLVPSLTNEVFVDVLAGVKEVLDARDHQMLIAITGYDDPGSEEGMLRSHLGYAPDGVLLTGVDQTATVRALVDGYGIPAVHMMDDSDRADCWWVGYSNSAAGHAIGRYLVERGRRRIGMITAQLDPRSIRRRDGCRAVLAEAGLYDPERDIAVPERSSIALGAELVERLLDRAPDCDAVFVGNDDLAQGAVFQCARRGVPVPGRLAVVGFHDLAASAWAVTPLTTVHTPRLEIGRRAAALLMDRIDGAATGPHGVDLGFHIVERASG